MKNLRWKPAILAAMLSVAAVAAHAQTFQTLITFSETNGAVPAAALIEGTDGNLYGTTQYGGVSDSGTVFRVTPQGISTILYSFCAVANCADGSFPTAALVQGKDGNFYGTTSNGGAQNEGTVFKITPSGSLSRLYSFCSLANCTDGAAPHAGLVQGADGNFYGTNMGSPAGGGTVFKITPSGTLSTLYTFCSLANCADGSSPKGGLIQLSSGNFYGTTSQAGAHGGGTVFQLTTAGVLTTIHSFCSLTNCTDGDFPTAALMQGSDGNLYGTTAIGGANGAGTVFKIISSGALTTLYSFCSLTNCADGEYSYGGLVQGTDGNLYGTTQTGAISNVNVCALGCGTFFKLTPAGALTTLYSFCSLSGCIDGAEPFAGVIQVTGTFYGTTSYGGVCSTRAEGCGTVFSWSPNVALAPSFSPDPRSFGNQAIDTSSSIKSINIDNVNAGTATLDLNSITLTGSKDFAISSTTCGTTLPGSKVCTVFMIYTPTVLGAESATLNVSDNAPGSPQTVPISGTGIAQASLLPSSYTFSLRQIGTTSPPRAITLVNYLPTTLSGLSYKIKGPFAVSSTTCTTALASSSSCTINVTFTPTVSGTSTGSLSVKDSANNSPQVATFTGTAD